MSIVSETLRTVVRRRSLTFALATLVAAPAARATTAWVTTSTEKILPSAQPGTNDVASLSAARNEFEAFQIAVEGAVSGVSMRATTLSGPAQIPAPRLFREALISLANPSGPDGGTGPYPDALVPDVDEVVGERRNAFPFDVPAGEARAVWAEVHVPADAPAGTYQGSVTVSATGQPDVTIPVALTVWNFSLPSTASLRSHFGLYYADLIQAHGVSGTALTTLRARYAQLGLDHRISIGGFDDGNTDLNHIAQAYGALIDGTAPTQLAGAKLTSVQYMGSRSTSSYASWSSLFRSRGWFDRLFDYTCDEPPATCAWTDIPARNAMMKAADPQFRSLVTTDVADATSNGVLSSIDLLVPVVNWMYDKPGNTFSGLQRPTYDAFLAPGAPKELWMYQSCMSHGCGGTSSYFAGWVTYAIDSSAIRSRGMEWLSFLYGATGELYWETTWAFENGDAWTNQWQFGGNGDGTLFYPGTPAKIGGQTDIPVASLRLKMLREGMEDYEYLKLLSDAGDPALASQLAGTLFPNPWTQPSVADLLAARNQIANRIVQLTATAGTSAGSGAPVPPTTMTSPATPSSTTPAVPAGSTSSTGTNASAAAGEPAPTASAPADPSATSTIVPIVIDQPSVNAKRLGAGCSAGASGDFVAGLGVAAALLLRRRRSGGARVS